MQVDDYTEQASTTNLMGNNKLYHFLGLVSEIGELAPYIRSDDYEIQALLDGIASYGRHADKAAKLMRNDNIHYQYTIMTTSEGYMTYDAFKKELGDIAWFFSQFIKSCDLLFSDVLQINLDKLRDRKVRNMLKGSGDFR